MFSARCKSKAVLVGKTALITGCNTGIGKETVMDFYKRGAKVIMACRDVNKAEESKQDIINKCKDSTCVGQIVVVKCDLSSLKSVRECAQNILDTEPQINIMVNNAGVMMCPKLYTEDGYEMQFATNHLSHFLLTALLLPRIRNSTPARIVTVSSSAYEFKNGINFDDIHYKNREYEPFGAYAQSKFANILFSKELASKLEAHNIEGINTYSLHPGVISTDILRHVNDTMFTGALTLSNIVMAPFRKNAHQGAQTTIYCSVDEKCADETGLYYSECAVSKLRKVALNEEYAKNLWEISAEQVALGDFDPFTATDPGIKAKDK